MFPLCIVSSAQRDYSQPSLANFVLKKKDQSKHPGVKLSHASLTLCLCLTYENSKTHTYIFLGRKNMCAVTCIHDYKPQDKQPTFVICMLLFVTV